MKVCNSMRMSKWWCSCYMHVNYPFTCFILTFYEMKWWMSNDWVFMYYSPCMCWCLWEINRGRLSESERSLWWHTGGCLQTSALLHSLPYNIPSCQHSQLPQGMNVMLHSCVCVCVCVCVSQAIQSLKQWAFNCAFKNHQCLNGSPSTWEV